MGRQGLIQSEAAEIGATDEIQKVADKEDSKTGKEQHKKRKKRSFWKDAVMVWAMMIPGLLYLIINNFLPMFGITIAFKSIDFSLDNIFASPWCGLDNFKYLFESDAIWLYIRNTVLYNVAFLSINMVIPVLLAILFYFVRSRVKRVYQTAILLPHLMSWVVVSYIGFAFFSGENGMLNALITACGGERINFYGSDAIGAWPFILIFFNTWKSVGFGFLFYYSSILSISPDLYEAAKLDGASTRKQIWHVTLPGLKPVMIMMFVMGLAGIVRSDYGLFYLVTKNSDQLFSVTQTIDTFIFNALKGQGDLVQSSAASVMQSIVGLVLILSANFILRKVDRENALF